MKLNTGQKVSGAFGLALAFLVLLAWFGYSTPRAFIALTAAQQHRVRLLEHLAAFISQMKDVETSQRGYLLTGNDEYLGHYSAARSQIERELDELGRAGAGQASYARGVSRLKELAGRKIAELERTIDLRKGDRDDGLAAALEIVNSDEGKRLMDEMRAIVAELESTENAGRDAAAAEANAAARRLMWVSSLVGPVSLLLVAAAGWIVLRDLAERTRVEDEVRQHRTVLEAILESMADAVVVADSRGKFEVFNPMARQILGLGASDARPEEWAAHYRLFLSDKETPCPADQVPLVRTLRGESLDNVELFVRRPEIGDGVFVNVNGRPLIDAEGRNRGGVTVFRDVTGRKRSDDIEQSFHFLIEATQEYAIYLLDADGRIASWNIGAERLKGYRAEEVLGKHFSLFYPPDAIAAGRPDRALEIARTQERYEEEGWRVCKDGSRIWASVVMTALRDGQGRLQGFGKITRDFTDRKETEDRIKRLNVELEERVQARTAELSESNRSLLQKNQEVETFVYSVSHDLRSPLVNLQGFSQELKMVGKELRGLLEGPGLPEPVRRRGLELVDGDMAEAIKFIRSGVTRLSNIIDALLRLSRAGRVVYQWQAVDLDPVVRRIVDALSAGIAEKGAAVQVDALPKVWGDPTAIEQVFANLIGNALNYLDPQRPGRIAIGTVDGANGAAAGSGAMKTLFVRDNGLGIGADVRDRIFHAFQRLHPSASPGEGIGLTLVSRIVERHGGRIWFESAAGAGTTFFVTLPVGAESAARVAPDRDDESSSPQPPRAVAELGAGTPGRSR